MDIFGLSTHHNRRNICLMLAAMRGVEEWQTRIVLNTHLLVKLKQMFSMPFFTIRPWHSETSVEWFSEQRQIFIQVFNSSLFRSWRIYLYVRIVLSSIVNSFSIKSPFQFRYNVIYINIDLYSYLQFTVHFWFGPEIEQRVRVKIA